MVDHMGSGPAWRNSIESYEAKRVERARRRSARKYLPQLPDDSGKYREAREAVIKSAGELFTGIGDAIDGVLNGPNGAEIRKHALSHEEFESAIKKYAKVLKQSQTEWQEGTGEIIHDILKLADNAAKLYEAYQEYPLHDIFKDYEEAKDKAANQRDYRISLINQAVALYYCNTLKDLDKLKITDKPEFKEAQHFLNTVKAKMSERADLHRAAKECERQAGLAQFQSGLSEKQRREVRDHSDEIQGFPDEMGGELYPKRLLKAGNVKKYSEQAEKQATELEKILEHVERHRRDTQAKINAYISQAQKRSNAANEVITRQGTVNLIFRASTTRAIDAGIRTTNSIARATATPIGHSYYKNLADNIIAGIVTPANITRLINNAAKEAKNAARRAKKAEARARDAARRAKKAEARVQEAEARARIAKAYNDPLISDRAAKDVEKHARASEKLEKEVVSNASLIQANEIKIQHELRSIAHNLRLLQAMAMKPGLTPQDRTRMLTELLNKVEKAEMTKNSAIVSEEQATRAEQKLLKNIRDELPKELAALASENATQSAITNRAFQDLPCLQTLVNQQTYLEETLRGTVAAGPIPARLGLIELERNESQVTGQIEEAIRRQFHIGGLKAREQACRDEVVACRDRFERALRNIEIAERAAAEALKRNAIHMGQDVPGDADQAIERLQKIKDDLAAQDGEGLKKRSQGHLFIDPKAGKFTLNGVWMSVREINSWDFSESGQTTVEFRPDITKIKLSRQSRDGSRIELEDVYTKRLLEKGIENEKFSIKLKIEGDTFRSRSRRLGVLTYIDKEAEKEERARADQADQEEEKVVKEEIFKRTVEFDMERANTIHLMIDLVNEKELVPGISYDYTVETMPDPVINHETALALRQGAGWSDEQRRHMWKLDLERRVLILPNGQEYPIEEFDWTETDWNKENGLTLQYKGPRELSQVNLLAAGSSDIFDEKLSDATTALKKKKREHLEAGIEWLKQSIRSYDENKIDIAIGSIQSYEGIEAYQSSVTKNELERPPKSRLDLEKLKKKKKAQKKWMAASNQATAGMLMAKQDYENKVKEHIRAIHKTNPLSADYIWKSRARPDIYSIQKHSSSQKKQELLDEIYAANHLDKTVSFQLLEDPKRGPTSATSPIKNYAPNGLELLREYNLYKNKQDFANQTERQNVEHYVASIATEFRTNPNIHPYYTNQWYFEQAIAAAKDGNISGKEENGNHIPGASEYIRNLKQVDCPLILDSLASQRQADEYHWVTYLRDALAQVDAEGIPEVLVQALPIAQWMQQFRSSNLKFAQKALDLETSSKEANKILDDMQTIELPLPSPQSEIDEKAKVDTTKDKNQFDPKAMTKKSDRELALEAGGVAEQIYKHAIEAIDHLIETTDDPILQKRYREAAVNLAMDIAKQAFQINKQDKDIQNQWQKLEVYIKEMNTQRWKDFWFTLAVFAFQQGPRAGADGAKKFMDEILKIAMKSVS